MAFSTVFSFECLTRRCFVHHPVVLSYVLNYVVLLNYACMYIEFMFLYKNYMNGYCMMLGCHVPYYKWQHS